MSFIPDSVLRKAIDVIFMKYDTNRSNSLQTNQLTGCFNELLGMVGVPTMANSFVVKMLLKKMDRDNNGSISKPQFLNMFRIFQGMGFMGQGNQQQQPQQNQGGWGGQQQQQQQQQGGWSNQPVSNQPSNYGNQGGNWGGHQQGGNQGSGFGY